MYITVLHKQSTAFVFFFQVHQCINETNTHTHTIHLLVNLPSLIANLLLEITIDYHIQNLLHNRLHLNILLQPLPHPSSPSWPSIPLYLTNIASSTPHMWSACDSLLAPPPHMPSLIWFIKICIVQHMYMYMCCICTCTDVYNLVTNTTCVHSTACQPSCYTCSKSVANVSFSSPLNRADLHWTIFMFGPTG